MKIGAFIICWTGKEENAKIIANEIINLVDELYIIYSNKDNNIISGSGVWVKVPDDWFFGSKFRETLLISTSNSILHIHADTYSENWPNIINNFKNALKLFPNLGIWTPEIKTTTWNTSAVSITSISETNYVFVAQTDCLVWGITSEVINRLKTLNYDSNKYGWGIDFAAVAFSYVNNLLVIRDTSIKIIHHKGTGYSESEANVQMIQFLEQLTMQEKVMAELLNRYVNYNSFVNNITR